MILKRFYQEGIAQASFLLGCQATGEAIVIDPNREVQQYLDAAASENLRITGVTETHIHADFVSGSVELAERAGAKLYLSSLGGPDWLYDITGKHVKFVSEGDVIAVGKLQLRVLHTPGHTPEHITFLLTDLAASPEPVAAFTGDFIFAGDVGRPDLLERAAGVAGTMETSARQLYHSLQRFRQMAGHLLVYPGHGAGSACGKKLGGMPVTTMGYERLVNWAFLQSDEEAFVKEVLEGQPLPPRYFATMKQVNKQGPALTQHVDPMRELGASEFDKLRKSGAKIVDVRPAADFGKGFAEGTVNIPFNKSFLQWMGATIDVNVPVYLLAPNEQTATEARRRMLLIGFDDVPGWFNVAAVATTQSTTLEKLSYEELQKRIADGWSVLDVRNPSEYAAGHIPGSVNVPLAQIDRAPDAMPKDGRVIVHCQAGGRSAIASSMLLQMGYITIADYTGGYSQYAKESAAKEAAVS